MKNNNRLIADLGNIYYKIHQHCIEFLRNVNATFGPWPVHIYYNLPLKIQNKIRRTFAFSHVAG